MSDDWAKKYIDIHKQKQQEKQNEQEKAGLAEAEASDVFQGIRDAVVRDIQTFHDAGVLKNLDIEDSRLVKEFKVVLGAFYIGGQAAFLRVNLSRVSIKYSYSFASQGMPTEEKHGTLQIRSDLNDVVRVHKNGEMFADESAVSHFLLRPLLDLID